MFKLALKPQWIGLFLLALALATGFVLLSHWQLSASTSSQIEADPQKEIVRPLADVVTEHEGLTQNEVDTMVEASGSYVPGSSYLVENKYNEGEQGYWVVSEFVPNDAPLVSTSEGENRRAVAVARAWTKNPELPAEPQGNVTIAGRVVANDAPYYSHDLGEDARNNERIIGSVATAQLMNLWNTPLYPAVLTADAEVPKVAELPLTDQGTLQDGTTIVGQTDSIRPIETSQVVDHEVNWLNIFYALEWIVFAGFAFFMWWRMLKDEYEKQLNPSQYYEYEGEYWFDEDSQRYFYWDPADQQYYFFDEVPEH